MNKFLKFFIIFILVSILIVAVPLKLAINVIRTDIDSVTLNDDIEKETYTEKNQKLINSLVEQKDTRKLATEVMGITSNFTIKLMKNFYILTGYIYLILDVVLICFGIYILKTNNDKRYVGKAFIISSSLSIIILVIYIINIMFTTFNR